MVTRIISVLILCLIIDFLLNYILSNRFNNYAYDYLVYTSYLDTAKLQLPG